jgi:acyl carrier protein
MISDIRTNIKTFIIDHLVKKTGVEIKDDSSFLDNGMIDSIGALELVAFLEETFKFSVEDEEIIPDNLDSVNKLVDYVNFKIGA